MHNFNLMGIGSSKKRPEKKEEPKPVTAEELKNLIKISQERCKLYRNKKVDNIRKTEEEIANCLKSNNLDLAKAKMDNLCKFEDLVTAYDIIHPILEIIKEKCTYIISYSECPAELRAPLDSIIYAANKLEIQELMLFKEKILQKYGSSYISKAENNMDKLVNENLVAKLRVTVFNEQIIKIRLKQLCLKKKIVCPFPEDLIVNVEVPTDMNQMRNIYESSAFPTQSMIQNQQNNNNNPYPSLNNQNKNQNPNPYVSNNGGQNPYVSNSGIQNPYISNNGSQSPYISNNGSQSPYISNNGPQNPYISNNGTQSPYVSNNGPQNPYISNNGTQSPYVSNNGTQNPYISSNGPQNPYENPQQPQNNPPQYIPPPINEPSVENLIGKTVSSTVPISEAPESKEQSQMKQSNQSSMNNQNITNNNTNPNPQVKAMANSAQNLNNNIDNWFNDKTVSETVNYSMQFPMNPKDPLDVKTLLESGAQINNDNKTNVKKNDEEEDLFGGATVEQTVNLSTQNQNQNSNIDFGGPTSKTMNMSISNPNGQENPYEGSTGTDPFDKNAKIKDPFDTPTIPEPEPKDPFASGAKIEDPFGGDTLPIDDKTA